jgi:hypothetical protein
MTLMYVAVDSRRHEFLALLGGAGTLSHHRGNVQPTHLSAPPGACPSSVHQRTELDTRTYPVVARQVSCKFHRKTSVN